MLSLIRLFVSACFVLTAVILQAQAPIIESFTPTTAGADNFVTITGNNFSNINEVKFGGVAASFFFVYSPTSIGAVVGNGASGDVTVTSSSGTGAKPGFVFVPVPVISGFSPDAGGLGTMVTITGANFTNINAVFFGNTNAQSFTILSDTVINAVVGPSSSGQIGVANTVGNRAFSTGIFTHSGPDVYSFSPTSGTGGTAVTIKGINFTGATGVSIGGIPVSSFTVDSSTAISAIVASGSVGFVKISTPLGSDSIGNFNKANITSFNPLQGVTGDTVSIRGYNFTTASAVSFGSVAASSFTLLGDTLIKAVVGNGSTGPVSVTTTSFGTASLSYFYYVIPYPQITFFTPAIGGPGTVVTIKGKNFTAVSSVFIGSTPATSYTVMSDSVISAVVGNGSTGYITLTDLNGSSSSLTIFTYATDPVIVSFSPTYGTVGTAVDIEGVNFAGTIDSNKVYFGPVAGVITAASGRHIKVIVPAGAGNSPLALTTKNKVVYSKKGFAITFPGDTVFTAGSFATKIDFATGYLPNGLVTGDFDDDGKPDLAVANYGDNNIGVYKNNSQNGAIAFAVPQLLASSTGPKELVAGDLDGDGKIDLATGSQSGISVFKNMSTTGSISFGPAYTTSTGIGNQSIALADFDSDGRPDLVAPNYDNTTTTVYRNTTTTGGAISFSGFNMGGDAPVSIATTDLNNDGKPDILVVNQRTASTIAGLLKVYKNTSTGAGSFTFQSSYYFFSPNDIGDIAVGDLDGDGKLDIAVTDRDQAKIYIARNTSTVSSITFDAFITLPSISILGRISIADLNGDKKIDIVVSNSDRLSSVYKNNSIPGVLSFSPYVTYAGARASCFSDVNGDGRPDMLFTGVFDPFVSILKNQTGPNVKTLCPSVSGTAIYSNIAGNTYQWQADTGTGFVDIFNNSNYNGVNAAALQLSNIPSSWYGYKYRNKVDGTNYSDVFELRISNTWTGAVGTEWENPANWSCGTVPDGFTDVVMNAGTVVMNSNVTIRSISIQPGVSFKVNTGYTLIVQQ